ncbi:amino acid ABC transporter permease [Leucobacter aridicollis]|nr:amino acid ABC transporter permease [Leucobacter aridicollis]
MEDRAMTASVLYDVPGPKAIRRNRILAVVTIVVVAAVIGFLLYRFYLTGQFTAKKWGLFTYSTIWEQILGALGKTLAAFGVAAIGSLILGFVLAIGRLSDHKWVRVPVTTVTELFRAMPVLIMMMLLYYGLPSVGVKMEPYWAVVIALIVYNGSVLAEVIRAGVESLPRGQKEAGYAIGLRKSGVMRLILMPQAVRAMLPVIVSQLVVTMKDTALGFIITYPELLYLAKQFSSNVQFGRPLLQSAFVIGGIYIVMCFILSGIAHYLERRLRSGGRGTGDPGLSVGPGLAQGGPDPRMHEGGTVTEVLSVQGGR